MILFFKGFIIGIAKIIPGVSGAMLAVSFGIYDKLINAITNFFDNKKFNFKFLLILGSSIILAIVLFSNIIKYLIKKYYFITMMFFIGLITGGTYNYSKQIKYNSKTIITIIFITLLILSISIFNINNIYTIKNNYLDYIMFFIGGFIEIFASIIPGISSTALLMILGIYEHTLSLYSNIFNITYILNNINLYLSYSIGLFLSFIICSLLISYLIKKYRNLFDTIIFSLSISSIILLIIMAFKSTYTLPLLFIGLFLFAIGLFLSYILDK